MVTNATWSVFWINEGFTMYLVRDRAYLSILAAQPHSWQHS